MYEFRDTIAAVVPDNGRSAESLCINGVWLEDVIPGFRVLNVKGRESYVKNVSTYTVADTEYYKKAVYKPRTIEVTYRLIAADNEAFREAFNTLNMYLAAEEAQLIFADEDDKYFIGTASDADAVPPGRNRITSSISFLCTDPRKYADYIKTFPATVQGGILRCDVVNEGNIPCDIDYEITHTGDNGFIGIASNKGVMQYGLTTEVDTQTEESKKILSYTSGSALMSHGTEDTSGGTFKVTDEIARKTYMAVDTLVGATGAWKGPKRTYSVLDDGEGSASFILSTRLWFECGKVSQTGAMAVHCYAGSSRIISLVVSKTSTVSDQANVDLYLKDGDGDPKHKATIPFNANALGMFRQGAGQLSIEKEGFFVIFTVGGTRYSYRVDALNDVAITDVGLSIQQYNARGMSWDNFVTRMYFGELKFTRNRTTYEHDIKNRYSAGDVLEIDGRRARAFLNGNPSDEQLGTVYFKAPVGNLWIDFYPSDWAWSNGVPRIEAVARIREAWI